MNEQLNPVMQVVLNSFFAVPLPPIDDESEEEPGICPVCNGSGEGMYDGTICRYCKGKGEV